MFYDRGAGPNWIIKGQSVPRILYIWELVLDMRVRSYVVGWSPSLARSVLSGSNSIKKKLFCLNHIVLVSLSLYHFQVLHTIWFIVGLDIIYLLSILLLILAISSNPFQIMLKMVRLFRLSIRVRLGEDCKWLSFNLMVRKSIQDRVFGTSGN